LGWLFLSGCFRTRPAVSENSEDAKNIILEFLYTSVFHSTASVFYTESDMRQIVRGADRRVCLLSF
jgi:hypothetical protein